VSYRHHQRLHVTACSGREAADKSTLRTSGLLKPCRQRRRSGELGGLRVARLRSCGVAAAAA
jgi:hypothetical protein